MLAFLLLIVCAVYANSFASGFVWDDNWLIISKQAFFSQPENAVKILTLPDAPLGGKLPYYRPLNTLTYMLDHYLWGLHPFWYHLENILLHALVVILFYLLLIEVFEDRRLAFFAAVLFAVYPVNTEAVDVISNRNTLFCAAFSLASLLFLAREGIKWTIMALSAYFLALLSKEPAVVLPFFLLTFGLTAREKRFKMKKRVLISFFAITAVYFVIRHLVIGAFIEKHAVEFSLSRLKLILAVYFQHFQLFVFPFKLNAYYAKGSITFSPLKGVAASAGLLFLIYLSLSKRSPAPVRAGAQWIFWGLLLVSNIVRIPSAPVADRYQYTIVFGFVLIVGYLLAGFQKKKALAGTALVSALVLALGAGTFERNFVWHDDISLYSSMVSAYPENVLALYDLGVAYAKAGRLEPAAGEFDAALAVDPGNVKARVNLGVAYAKEGRLDEAIREFSEAATINPGYAEARMDLGVAYEKEGRLEEAASEFQGVLALDPGNAQALEYMDRTKGLMGGR